MNMITDLATRLNVTEEVARTLFEAGHAEGRKATVSSMKANAGDIRVTTNMYEEAANRGMSLSTYLDTVVDPENYNDGLDAFQRQLALANIKTISIPSRGLWSDPISRFWDSDRPGSEVLFPEWMARQWRMASLGSFDAQVIASEPLARFYASSSPVSDVLNPAYINSTLRAKKFGPAIPLSELVAIVTPVDTDSYKSFFLTDSETNREMRRVGQGAEVPTAVLTGADHSISLYKYGRRLEASYESIRRMRIDRFAIHLAQLAVQAEVDKCSTAYDVLLNGDGNAGTTPTNSNLTALDAAATADTLTLRGWLAWLQLWGEYYTCTTVLARSAYALQVLLLTTGSANTMLMNVAGNFGIGGVTPINQSLGPVRLGWTSEVTDKYLLGFDNRITLEMVQEVGTSLTETNKIISRQVDEYVMTEVVGFAIMDANSLRTMNVNA